MKSLIIGAGALGIAIGASLKKGGFDIDFLVREATQKAIDTNGLVRTGLFEGIIINAGEVGTYTGYSELPKDAYDYVIISTKTIANEEVSEALANNKACMKEDCKIVFMQNGMGYEYPFLDKFDKSQLYHSRVITGFKREDLCRSVITAHQAPILIGSLYGFDSKPIEPIVEAINESGMQAQVEDNISKAIWSKLIYNTTLNPLSAILDMSYGELADSEHAHSIMDILIEECFEIMKAVGGCTYWNDADEYREALFGEMIPVTYDHRSSTLQDIEKKNKTEIDTLTGSLLNFASQCNVAAPMHSMVYYLVKALEEKFQ